MNRQCSVTKRVQTSKGMRYCPVAWATNGRDPSRCGAWLRTSPNATTKGPTTWNGAKALSGCGYPWARTR